MPTSQSAGPTIANVHTAVAAATAVPPRLLEVFQVAQRLSLCEDYVRELIRREQLPAIRIGVRYRVDPADLQEFIDARRVGPAAGSA